MRATARLRLAHYSLDWPSVLGRRGRRSRIADTVAARSCSRTSGTRGGSVNCAGNNGQLVIHIQSNGHNRLFVMQTTYPFVLQTVKAKDERSL